MALSNEPASRSERPWWRGSFALGVATGFILKAVFGVCLLLAIWLGLGYASMATIWCVMIVFAACATAWLMRRCQVNESGFMKGVLSICLVVPIVAAVWVMPLNSREASKVQVWALPEFLMTGVPALVGSAIAAMVDSRRRLKAEIASRSRCPQCDYSLAELPPDSRCPECGMQREA